MEQMNTHDDNHIPEGAEIFQDIPPIYENDDGIEDEYADDEIEVDISPAAFQLAIQETSLFFKLSIDELSNKLNNVSVELWKTAMDLNIPVFQSERDQLLMTLSAEVPSMDPEFGMKWVGDHLISLREVNNSKNIKKVYVYLCIGRGKRNKMRLSLSDIVVVLLGDGPALAQEGMCVDHLCIYSRCIAPGHLIVASKDDKTKRETCRKDQQVSECICKPKCIRDKIKIPRARAPARPRVVARIYEAETTKKIRASNSYCKVKKCVSSLVENFSKLVKTVETAADGETADVENVADVNLVSPSRVVVKRGRITPPSKGIKKKKKKVAKKNWEEEEGNNEIEDLYGEGIENLYADNDL